MIPSPEKNDKGLFPSAAIDGSKIRSIREQKKLTQLYVANVVGVTTDTISRWENNRYPSIKRENAEKLAGALEVELSDILRQEEDGDEPASPPSPATPPRSRRYLWAVAGGILLLLVAVLLIYRQMSAAPASVRWAPRFAAPDQIIPVQIRISRQGAERAGFILKEHLPPAWRLITTAPSSATVESPGSVIKWLIPRGTGQVTVSYTAQLPRGAALGSSIKLQGEIVNSGGINRSQNVGGDDVIQVRGVHWADVNGDGSIDDNEIMPAYYICEEMKGFQLDWKTIEAIWSGKGYSWSLKEGFTVRK